MRRKLGIIFCLVQACILSACSVTVGSIEGTSESFENTIGSAETSIEASAGFTSSTSPRADHSAVQARTDIENQQWREAKRFTEGNYANLKADIAVGGGEYLDAIAEIFQITPDARQAFYLRTKTHYPELFVRNKANISKTVDLLYSLSKT